ncbi:MAG: hypothetical protein ACXVAX_08240, partial [Pseudobdellovibrio sp.]
KMESNETLSGSGIFLGYSFGGRLGLRHLAEHGDVFDRYIFVSTNPGLKDDDQTGRNQRLLNDQQWAEKITKENWHNFIREWNTQGVFAGSKQEPVRNVEDYDLEKLRNYLLNYSLAQQPDFEDLIKKFRDKITWIVGSEDKKYIEIAENLKSKGCLTDFKKITAGHRVHLDNTQALAAFL